MIKFRLLFSLILCVLSFNALAQTTPSLVFLSTASGARQLGLNEATTAIPIDGLNALVNPATISGVTTSMISASYTIWGVPDTKISSFSTVLKEKNQTLSFSLLSNSTGNIETRSVPGNALSSINVDYMALTAAYAYQFNYLSAGLSLSYVNEQYLINNASGYSFGFGLYSSLWKEKIRVGLALNHIGEMSKLNERASKLPSQFRAGIDADLFSFTIPGDLSFPVLFSATTDYIRYIQTLDESTSDSNVIQNDQTVLVGLRVFVADLISINGGLRLLDESNRNWSMGLGIHQGDFKFDFAMIPFETGFNTGYSIGMMYNF